MAVAYFTRAFLRIVVEQKPEPSRDVLVGVVTGQFTTVQNGGLQMISSSMPGQSFSFSVDASLSVRQIMETAEEALEILDSVGIHGVRAMLNTKPATRARAYFGGGY